MLAMRSKFSKGGATNMQIHFQGKRQLLDEVQGTCVHLHFLFYYLVKRQRFPIGFGHGNNRELP